MVHLEARIIGSEVAVPVYSKLKVASVVAAERVAVRAATPAAFSAIAVVPVRVTVGTDCSSVMVTVAESGVPIVVPFPPQMHHCSNNGFSLSRK
jgi:hypothetical protein